METREGIYDVFDIYFVRAREELGWDPDFDSMQAGFIGTMLKIMEEDLY